MFHLTLRVAWHDSRWNGTVCRAPSCNSFCAALDRIRETRDDAREDSLAGRRWAVLPPDDLPPCKSESGAFMNPDEWTRRFEHPFARSKKAAATHGHLRATSIKVPPYSTFAVPYAWMLRDAQQAIDDAQPEPLPPDEDAPFEQAWVFGRARQEALLKLFFRRLVPERSLVFFYCKEGHPLGDGISRLVMGIGRITAAPRAEMFEVEGSKPSYVMWDHLIRHSVRPDGEDGFLLPYHDYLESTGDATEDARRLELLREIAVAVDPAHLLTFSFVAEHAPPDIALSTLVRALEAVRKIREHGIAKGPWERREEWLNAQIAAAWRDRGAFPGLGPALEALGLRLGTALSLELIASKTVASDGDPWPVVDAILRGARKAPQSAYEADVRAVRDTWAKLPDERRALLKLLSRFALTQAQAVRWFDETKRSVGTSALVNDRQILENPYRMSEVDLGDLDDTPVSIGTIDRGVLPDSTIAAKHPLPSPSVVGSTNDPRRVRAVIVAALRRAAQSGDALVGVAEALHSVQELDLSHPCVVPTDWPATNEASLAGVVERLEIHGDGRGARIAALQLTEHKVREDYLETVLARRAGNPLAPIVADWKELLATAISRAGGKLDPKNRRHVEASEEQARALQRLTSRRLSVLVGKAGTGKTSVMGALVLCPALAKDGILFLAPTGKARVRLGDATNAEAMTVAQFLHRLERYDSARQRVRFTGKDKHRKEKTVVIDECSMLTMDDLAAVLEALDLAHVQRLILVGDPNQLPPIGVGRPFADLVTFLENTSDKARDGTPLGAALARLTVEVRAVGGGDDSDALRLASWFTRERQPVDADRVLSDLELGGRFNDLTMAFWKTPAELRERLLDAFRDHLGVEGPDVAAFNASLGLDENGMVAFAQPEGAERWQILSPVRMHAHGVHDLNRWVQRQFRGREVTAALERRGPSLGDETIVARDKVIQTRNEWRKCFQWTNREQDKLYIANGEVGLIAPVKGNLKVLFAGRPQVTFDYWPKQFGDGHGPLELAYALTVHKAQGSEFKRVFVVVPKQCRLLSRELLYTALTRSREHLVLLIEGDDATALFDLTRPERSETTRRNTNIFDGVIREAADAMPHAEHLIHRTDKGHMVRSKSDLVIANMLYQLRIPYEYKRVCEGTAVPGRLRPDFSFVTADGDVIVWEHLGRMESESHRRGWDWKREWYEQNGFVIGQSLFASEESAGTGLDSVALRAIAMQIKALLGSLEAYDPHHDGVREDPPRRGGGREPPMKHTILFLAANPSGTDRLALDREARAIQVELERSGHRDCFEFETRWAAEPLDLLRELRRLKPTVVHFSGHGGQEAGGEHAPGEVPRRDALGDPGLQVGEQRCGLFFQDSEGRAQVVSTAALRETFGAAGASVKLVVLNACYSEAHAEALLAHVDCVVGMNGSIRDDVARNFAIGFYGGLGERESIATAYKQGRAAISLEGLHESERPQLKIRDGVDADQLVLAIDLP